MVDVEMTLVLSHIQPGVTSSTVTFLSADENHVSGLSSTVVRIVLLLSASRVSVIFVLMLFSFFVLQRPEERIIGYWLVPPFIQKGTSRVLSDLFSSFSLFFDSPRMLWTSRPSKKWLILSRE